MNEKTSLSPSLRLPVAFAFFGFVVIGINGGANGIILPSLSAFYHVGDATIGLLFLVSSMGYFLSALSSGLLVERLGLRWMLLFGTVVYILGASGFEFKLPFVALLFSRLLLGLGVGLMETGLNIYITALPRSTALLNHLHAYYGVGALIGPVIASAILAFQWGWNSVYLLLIVLSLPLLCGFGLLYSSAGTTSTIEDGEQRGRENVLSAALKLPIVWLAAIFLLVYVGVEVSLGNWGYSFLLDRHEGTILAGWIISGYWFGLTLGRFTLQSFAERLGLGTQGLMYACIVGVGIGLLLVWFVPFSLVAAIGFCFIGYSLAPIYPLTVAIAPKLVPARIAPSAIGLLVSVSILGLAFFPWLAGILAQARGIWTLLPYTLALVLAMLVLWRSVVSYRNTDTQRIVKKQSSKVL